MYIYTNNMHKILQMNDEEKLASAIVILDTKTHCPDKLAVNLYHV